jgi:hypothetical protein
VEPGRRYDEAEARAILDRALRRDAKQGIEHDELVAAAREVGISEDALETALEEVEQTRAEDEARRSIIRRRRRGLANHALAYGLVCGSLTLVALLLTGGLWFLWPVILWGTGLVFHARGALQREVSADQLRRELRRRERAADRERRLPGRERPRLPAGKRHEALEQGAEQLGAAVEKGVALLMSKVAEKIQQELTPKPDRPGRRSDSTRDPDDER